MDHYDEGMNLSCGPYLYTRLTRFSLSIIRFRLLSTCRAGRAPLGPCATRICTGASRTTCMEDTERRPHDAVAAVGGDASGKPGALS